MGKKGHPRRETATRIERSESEGTNAMHDMERDLLCMPGIVNIFVVHSSRKLTMYIH